MQRICCWVLKKLGAFQIGHDVTITKHTVKPKDFMEAVFRQRRNIEYEFNRRPTKMYIGADDYQELMKAVEVNTPFMFRAEYNIDRRVMGLDVHVVPWMKGILLLPKEF